MTGVQTCALPIYKLMAAFKEANEAVRVAQANLALVKAGAKQGDIEAQKASIARLQAEKTTEIKAQQANINRLQVEKSTEATAQQANINRLQAEKAREIEAQRATIARLEAALENGRLDRKSTRLNSSHSSVSRMPSSA